MATYCPDSAADDTRIVVQKAPLVPTFPTGGTKSFHISANSLDSSGAAETVYLTLVSPDIGAAALSTGCRIDSDFLLDAETMALVSNARFMELLEQAEHDIAEGRGISGDELRRQRG